MHEREAVTPLPNGTLLADCTCGGSYSVPQGGDEYAALEAAHQEHALTAPSNPLNGEPDR